MCLEAAVGEAAITSRARAWALPSKRLRAEWLGDKANDRDYRVDAALSADGRLLATATNGGPPGVVIRDVATGRPCGWRSARTGRSF